MVKKAVKRILLILGIAVLINIVVYKIDEKRFMDGEVPIFIVRTEHLNDGGTTIYRGVGYQLIDWKIINDENTGDISYFVGRESHYLLGMLNPADGPSIELEEIREK